MSFVKLFSKPYFINQVSSLYFSRALFAAQTMSGDGEGLPLTEVIQQIEKLADPRTAESWDNVGLLIHPYTPVLIKNILLTNDLTENVLEEAVNGRANMIISYHPPIFSSFKRISGDNWKDKIVACCLKNDIAVYSPHTAWDAVLGGVTDWLASAFDGHFDGNTVTPIVKCNYSKDEANGHSTVPTVLGMGRILNISNSTTPPLTLAKCVELVKRHTGLVHVRLAIARGKSPDSPVTSIGLVPGSGGSLLKTLLFPSDSTHSAPSIDLFLTGEMLHHDILDAVHRGVSVILTNHSDSERGFLKIGAAKLRSFMGDKVRIAISTTDKDPLQTV